MNRLLIFVLLACVVLGACSSQEPMRRILVIHSYDNQYDGYPEFNRSIAKQFKKERINADIRTFYLDCEKFSENDEIEQMNYLLDSITSGWKPEIIIVNEDQATYSLLAGKHPLTKELPIVFGGVNYPNYHLIEQCPNVTGFRDRIDFLENIKVSKELLDKNIQLFTILDYTYIDRQIRADLCNRIEDNKILGFCNTPFDSIFYQLEPSDRVNELNRLIREEGYTYFRTVGARTDSNSAGLMWMLRKEFPNRCYVQLKRDFSTLNIGNICYAQSLTAINEGFGFGERLLGGYITTQLIQVEEEVHAAVRILRGEKPSDIPITDSKKEYVVDWTAMSHWKIPLSRIPIKYSIINIPIWDKNPVLWTILLCLTTLSIVVLIVWLFMLYHREQKRRKEAANALVNEKQTLALAIEGSDTYAWKFENGIFSFEKAFWKSQRITSRELTLDMLLLYIHPDQRSMVVKYWNRRTERKNIAQIRCDFNGSGYLWWEFRFITIIIDSNKVKMAGLLLNIQEIKDREKELEKARRLAEKAELKQSFLANMSHEIRTPLNAIVGFSNLLTSDENLDSDEKQIFIETINRNNELLLKLINDILDLSRMESGAISFQIETISLSELIEDIYTTHQIIIPANLKFIKEVAPMPIYLDTDRIRMTQVVSNFLNNASKFTEHGHITLGYYHIPHDNKVCIYVEDSGRGIPCEEQKMIFERFYKQNEFSQGTGLGLSICQVIVEKLGGTIDLWSEPGKGSRFMVLLPCSVAET